MHLDSLDGRGFHFSEGEREREREKVKYGRHQYGYLHWRRGIRRGWTIFAQNMCQQKFCLDYVHLRYNKSKRLIASERMSNIFSRVAREGPKIARLIYIATLSLLLHVQARFFGGGGKWDQVFFSNLRTRTFVHLHTPSHTRKSTYIYSDMCTKLSRSEIVTNIETFA